MIPFNQPYVTASSKAYSAEVLESNHQQGDGPYSKRAASLISQLTGGGITHLTPSCTHALEMASMLGEFGPGDEVILPSYTFTSGATAITQFGATPVFVDIDPITKCLDVDKAAKAITSKTKAISWVNYAGAAPDMNALLEVAKLNNLILIEDNAHGLGGSYKGRPLGSFGDFATQSFHATKNIQCGEGGALIINNQIYAERAEIIREKGTDRSRYFRGQVDKYQWVDLGSSYLLAESLAGVLLGQLENFDDIQSRRLSIWYEYEEALKPVLSKLNWQLGSSTKFSTNIAHMLYLELKSPEQLNYVLNYLHRENIGVATHYVPLDTSLAGLKFGRTPSPTSISRDFSSRMVRLPLFYMLDSISVHLIVEALIAAGSREVL